MVAKILRILLGLSLVLLVACGSAAPEPTAAPDPTATQAASTVPAGKPTAAPAMGDTSQPTATPQMAAAPADVEVNPGKLTMMIGEWVTSDLTTLLRLAPDRGSMAESSRGFLLMGALNG